MSITMDAMIDPNATFSDSYLVGDTYHVQTHTILEKTGMLQEITIKAYCDTDADGSKNWKFPLSLLLG
jgi:hypothetical protein